MSPTADPAVVVVAGGTGNIGEGIVRSALRSGSTVIVPSRDAERLTALRRYVTDAGIDVSALHTVETDIGSFDGAHAFVADTTEKYGPIDLSVASLGGWWSGPPLLGTSEADWRKVMRDNLDAHYFLARHVLPTMQGRGGVHLLIGGPANLQPDPGSTLITIAGRAQLALAQILDEEAKAAGARAYELFVAQILDRRRGGGAGGWKPVPGAIIPDQIGDRAIELYRERPDSTTHTLFATPIPDFPL